MRAVSNAWQAWGRAKHGTAFDLIEFGAWCIPRHFAAWPACSCGACCSRPFWPPERSRIWSRGRVRIGSRFAQLQGFNGWIWIFQSPPPVRPHRITTIAPYAAVWRRICLLAHTRLRQFPAFIHPSLPRTRSTGASTKPTCFLCRVLPQRCFDHCPRVVCQSNGSRVSKKRRSSICTTRIAGAQAYGWPWLWH